MDSCGPEETAPRSAIGRLRNASVSVADRLLNTNPQLGMWRATGTAIAYAPNLDDLRTPETGGKNIVFDKDGHSARVPELDEGREELAERMQRIQSKSTIAPFDSRAAGDTSVTSDTQQHPNVASKAKVPWTVAIKHGFAAAAKFILTPTGFLITVYGLNVVAWGAMLFFLLLHAAPTMNHPDNGDVDSSPRKMWLEIDSQILNALFCLTAFGLAPWRFRDLYWVACWRLGASPEHGHDALKKLAKRNNDWFRMGGRHGEEHLEDARNTFTGKHAPPTKSWKLDLMVWLTAFNTFFQVGMAFFMWHWNRVDRPSWGTGTFIGLGCGVSLTAGVLAWWEGRKIKLIEGPKLLATPKEADAFEQDDV
ncbi:hypothetical protein D6D01_08510 [Aureobasidium pullulans]|uniref:Uncharacterized protein n=1 Tax=Aureobasidium pullulans TaxID=5580 RepID=A0A4V6TEG9_AURPU|nr:hypothetical protein D6D01_08510 [Aureobasidium pullulans]